MPLNELDKTIQNTLGNHQHHVFFQHQYSIVRYKSTDKKQYLTTAPLENCVAVFIYGKINDDIIAVGIHIGINQTEAQIHALIKKLKDEFTEVTKITLVGGDFGITPPPFRSNAITNAVKLAITKYLGVKEFIHEHYNRVGNLACCCYSLFLPFAKKYAASLNLATGEMLVSSNEDVCKMILKKFEDLITMTEFLLAQQTKKYCRGDFDSYTFLTPEDVLKQYALTSKLSIRNDDYFSSNLLS
ncbi:MAG: hypothetical protein WBE18_07460 [Gammaproteobacteria bacterium]